MSMKILFVGLMVAFVSITASFAQSTANGKSDVKKTEASQWVTLKVTGMTCAGCASHIQKALSEKEGILDQEVKYPGDLVRVKFDPDKIKGTEVQRTITALGYKVNAVNTRSK